MILYLYPRSEQKAPLNALIAGMKKQPTDDPEFSWFEKAAPVRHTAVNYSTGYASTVTASITVDDATMFRQYDLIKNDNTGEVMLAAADGTGTTLVIHASGRGYAGSAATNITDNDVLFVVGNMIAEGSGVRNSLYRDPTKKYNYTQIFREPLAITNTAKATHLRSGKPYAEMKREALDRHTIDMERAFIFGEPKEDTATVFTTEPARSTGGILSFLSTNETTVSGGTLTYTAFMQFLEGLFAKGSGEKLCFCGNRFLLTLNLMAEARGEFNLTAGASVYGIKVTEWITPFGVVYIKNHPLFNEITPHTKMGLFIEPKHIIYRPLVGNGVNRDTKFLTARQDPDEDRTVDEFMTECGLEVQHEAVHGVLYNVNAYSA